MIDYVKVSLIDNSLTGPITGENVWHAHDIHIESSTSKSDLSSPLMIIDTSQYNKEISTRNSN